MYLYTKVNQKSNKKSQADNMNDNTSGKFIISLDFELMWGVRDVVSIESYGLHIKGVHTAIPKMLEIFKNYHVKATFAAVGFLFFRNKTELMSGLPTRLPLYADNNLSPYGDYLAQHLGEDRESDPYHFGNHLVELIKNTPGQEIATHTFSHYYCLEAGQTAADFEADLRAAIAVAEKRGIKLQSIIFPRNQVNEKYLQICADAGITNYRSNERSWIYEARRWKKENIFRRSIRLLDAYINMSGHHCYDDAHMKSSTPINIPSSRFLRPYTPRLRWFEKWRLRRIKRAMTHAAKNKLLYHLWWHPHNFGINQDQNIAFLGQILSHYQELKRDYGFCNYTMAEFAQKLAGHNLPTAS